MSRKNKALRAFLHNNPDATVQDAWDAAWANQQGVMSSLKHQSKEARIKELERERELMIKAASTAFGCFWNGGWYQESGE